MRRRAAASRSEPESLGDSEAPPARPTPLVEAPAGPLLPSLVDLSEEPGPESLTQMTVVRRPAFAEEEHTASDLEIPSMVHTLRGEKNVVHSEAEPFALTASKERGPLKPNAPPIERSASPVDYRTGNVVIQEGVGGNWNPSELLEDSVVSSVPATFIRDGALPGSPRVSPPPPAKRRSKTPAPVAEPSPPAQASSFARVPERSVEVVHVRPLAKEYADPWNEHVESSVPASLEDPTIVPRVAPLEAELLSEARIDDATIGPAMAAPALPDHEHAAEAEPNTIVPRLMPRDRNGRLAYEPTLEIEDLSSELLIESTGESMAVSDPEDLVLHTGDFESYDADRLGASGVLETAQRRALDPHDLAQLDASFAPSISLKSDELGMAEDLATDPTKSLDAIRGYGVAEDLATDPQKSLDRLRDSAGSRSSRRSSPGSSRPLAADSSWADDSARPHFEASDEPVSASPTEVPPPNTARLTSDSAWPAVTPQPSAKGGRELTAPLASSAYQPKSSARLSPVWQSEADGEERALQDEGRWEDLCELLLSRLDHTPSPMPRSRLLLRLAGVLEDRLNDYAQAFDGLLEAYGCAPDDPQIVERVEALATRLDRFPALVDTTMERLGSAKPPDRIALLANAVRWYEGPIRRPDAAGFYVTELERVDPAHPVLLVRKANAARARGDHGAHLELLLRALDRTKLARERVAIHLAVGEAQRIPSEAMRHFEAAIEHDPTNMDALLGFERAALRFDRFAEVQWCLEQLLEHAEGTARIEAHVRLADLLEKRFLKREEAAGVLRTLLILAPENEAARISLERCYLALRDFGQLVEAASARGEHARTPKAQAEAFAFAADMAETKLGDQVLAAQHMRRASLADPTNEAYLTRAAKLAERMQEPALVAEYRSRLAEILPDPKKRAQQYLVIAASLDDPLAQRGYYERAAKADPGSAAAWEALERIARELGDTRGVVTALTRRIDATESQRVKAQLLVELGGHLAASGDEYGATTAYDSAFRADPSNERAAAAVLSVLVEEGRFAEAMPACELLVTAASRDRDSSQLFVRLRTSAKIAIGLGDLGKALGACIAAMDALPSESQPLSDLVEILSRAPEGGLPDRARADLAFGRILGRADELDPDALVKLGSLLATRGEHQRAVDVLMRVLESGGHEDARALLEALGDSLLALGDLPRAADMKLRLSRVEATEEARYTALVSAIEILAHKVCDLPATRPVVEEALALRPDDHWLLHTAMWLYGELDDWARLAEVLERIVGVQETPDRRAKSLFTLAQVVGDKLGDKVRAAGLYDDTLDADKKRLDAFEALTRMLDDVGDYAALERAYRKMIARVRDDGDDELVFTLFKNLAAVYSDRLGNTELAQKALEGAKRVKPDDSHVKDAAIELLIARDELDQAFTLLRKDLERDPHDRKSYELLYGVFLRQGKFDRALTTAQILSELRPSTDEEALFISDYPPLALGAVPGSLVEEAWPSHLYHSDLDPMLTSIFAWMTPAVCRMREAQMSEDERMAAYGKPLTRQATRHAETIRQMFADASEILAFGASELLVGRVRNVPFAPSLVPYGAVLVNPDALTGIEGILPYLVGKRLAEQRPELVARGFFPAVTELTSMLATAVRVGLGERGGDPAAQKLDRALYQVMSDEERSSVSQAVKVAQGAGGKLDVKRWSQAADISSMRVGLLLAQDVRIAKKAVAAEPQGPSDLTPREKLGELYLFATSDLYADLRQAVGVNLADGGPASSALRD